MSDDNQTYMHVIKRDGTKQRMQFDKIGERLSELCDMEPKIDKSIVVVEELTQKIIATLENGCKTSDLDIRAANICAGEFVNDPEYYKLASRIVISNLHKTTSTNLLQVYGPITCRDQNDSRSIRLVSKNFYDLVKRRLNYLDEIIDYQKDYTYDFFAIKTLMHSYLLRNEEGHIIERPQQMLMRVALALTDGKISDFKKLFRRLSDKEFIFSTPTMTNAGTMTNQLASCYLSTFPHTNDIVKIFEMVKKIVTLSSKGGGVSINLTPLYPETSYLKQLSHGGIRVAVELLSTARKNASQLSNNRTANYALYLSVWHCEILEFVEMVQEQKSVNSPIKDLFYAIWVDDLFIERVTNGEMWSLFSPKDCSELEFCYGESFVKLYEQMERDGKAVKQMKANDLFDLISQTIAINGMPYILFKDASNKKSNHKNFGTLRLSNLCTEIMEYVSDDEIAICTLGSICLPKCVKDGRFDYEYFHELAYEAVKYVNLTLERNNIPLKEASTSNARHRPIGIGVMGMGDLYCMLKISYESEEAAKMNKTIFETLYHAALRSSCDLSKIYGPHPTFHETPAAEGILQFHMWGVKPSDLYDWKELINDIKKFGLRNSLLIAQMPTCTVSQVQGVNDGTEIYTSNFYVKVVSSGNYNVFNQHLVKDLKQLGLWDADMMLDIVSNRGSIQNIERIPNKIKTIYKTVWETSQKLMLNRTVARGPFICQSESRVFYKDNLNRHHISTVIVDGCKMGLKSGIYYFRTRVQVAADEMILKKRVEEMRQKFKKRMNLDTKFNAQSSNLVNSLDKCNDDVCLNCS